jgi:acetyl-CoA synthetase (ADP-forming)
MNDMTSGAAGQRDTVEDLRTILSPRGVALVGATDDVSKFGGRALRYLLRHGFEGGIYPVNPSRTEVLGLPCFPSIAAIGKTVDVALLLVPGRHLLSAVEECGAAGLRGAIVVTSDFAEAGSEGARRQEELVAAGRRAGVRLIGPNCLGFVNPARKLALSSSVALAVDRLPCGAIGMVSQSGSVMASMLSHAYDDGSGFSVCATVGNQADIDACDFIDYFAEDPATRVVCAYLEGVTDGARLIASASRCRAAGKPLLIVKSGRTAAGAAIAQSHTASLAGSYEVLEAVCRRHSAVLLDDPENMIKTAEFLAAYGVPRTDGIAALTPSGGTAAITGDRISAAGLRLAEPNASTVAKLRAIFGTARHVNPLDVGGMPADKMMEAAVRPIDIFAADPDVGTIAVAIATSPALEKKAAEWSQAAEHCGKPVMFVVTPGSVLDPVRKVLRDHGRPYCNTMDQAIAVLRASAAATTGEGADVPVRPMDMPHPAEAARALQPGRLLEPEAKSLLFAAGIPVTREMVARDVRAAVEFAKTLGGPVVLKIVSREIVHKSDIGGVKVGLDGEGAIRTGWDGIMASVATHAPEAKPEGLLVQEMAGAATEMIVGARWDPQFGPTVLVGMGGVQVELIRDVCIALAPLSLGQAADLVRTLRLWPLLDGYRGRPKADLEALCDTLARLSWLVADLDGRLTDIEINPLFVRDAGKGVLAVDARGVIA